MKIQKRIWDITEVAKPGDSASKFFDIFILILIALNILAVILESVESLEQRYRTAFQVFELFSVAVFTAEYLARVWSCVVTHQFAKPVSGRIRFMLKPLSLIDLLSVLPFYLTFVSIDLRFIRLLRLMRIFQSR